MLRKYHNMSRKSPRLCDHLKNVVIFASYVMLDTKNSVLFAQYVVQNFFWPS
jgi:hypothetical protein